MVEILKTGLAGFSEKVVKKPDCASSYGSGTLNVFATPALIAMMERTAMESVQNFLPVGFTTVGTEICIKHLKAAGVGQKIRCTSVLKEIDDRKLTFEVTVEDDNGLIGSGKHERYIVETERFMSKLKK